MDDHEMNHIPRSRRAKSRLERVIDVFLLLVLVILLIVFAGNPEEAVNNTDSLKGQSNVHLLALGTNTQTLCETSVPLGLASRVCDDQALLSIEYVIG